MIHSGGLIKNERGINMDTTTKSHGEAYYAYRKSHPATFMVQSAQDRAADDMAHSTPRGNGASLFNDK